MNFDDQLSLEHLLFKERKCRVCKKTKDLIEGYYLTRKDRESFHHHILMNVKNAQKNEYSMLEKRTIKGGNIQTGNVHV